VLRTWIRARRFGGSLGNQRFQGNADDEGRATIKFKAPDAPCVFVGVLIFETFGFRSETEVEFEVEFEVEAELECEPGAVTPLGGDVAVVDIVDASEVSDGTTQPTAANTGDGGESDTGDGTTQSAAADTGDGLEASNNWAALLAAAAAGFLMGGGAMAYRYRSLGS
jgi:hypothetical protein